MNAAENSSDTPPNNRYNLAVVFKRGREGRKEEERRGTTDITIAADGDPTHSQVVYCCRSLRVAALDVLMPLSEIMVLPVLTSPVICPSS